MDQGITHILSIEFRPLPTDHQKDFGYKFIHALDTPDQDLLSHFQVQNIAIAAEEIGRNVCAADLVHSLALFVQRNVLPLSTKLLDATQMEG